MKKYYISFVFVIVDLSYKGKNFEFMFNNSITIAMVKFRNYKYSSIRLQKMLCIEFIITLDVRH